MSDRPSAAELRDDGDREPEKGTDAPEVEVVNRQMAPKVSVKVERKQNLGDYNSVTAQVFFSSGTLEQYRGELTEDGEVREEIKTELNQITTELQELAKNRVLDALKKHANAGVDVDTKKHEVSS